MGRLAAGNAIGGLQLSENYRLPAKSAMNLLVCMLTQSYFPARLLFRNRLFPARLKGGVRKGLS